MSGTVSAAQISGGLIGNAVLPPSPVFSGAVAAGSFAGNGVNVTNVNAATLNGLNATNFWQLGGNNVASGQIIGSTNNQPVEIWVNNQRALRIEPNTNGAPNMICGSSVNYVAPGVMGAVVGGGGAMNYYGVGANQVDAIFGTIAGGLGNSVLSNADFSTVCGGKENQVQVGAYESFIGGGFVNTIQKNSNLAIICGGQENLIQADDEFAVIGGGLFNTIQTNAETASIGGGAHNTVEANSWGATTVGGVYNTIQTNSDCSFLGGGYSNSVAGVYSVISGGLLNSTVGNYSVVPGGYENKAQGHYSFVAGQQAQALHQGAFVWADSQNAAFASTTNDEFSIRAQNGVRIQTDAGIHLDALNTPIIVRDFDVFANTATNSKAGIGRWGLFMEPYNLTLGIPNVAGRYFQVAKYSTSGAATQLFRVDQSGNVLAQGTVTANGVLLTSDRNAKENFALLNPQAVLAKVTALPVTEWNYKSDDAAQKHIGPMAQDFQAAFQLSADDKHISVVDEGGVALAAIQGLNEKLEARSQKLEVENAALKQSLAELKQLVQSLAEKK